MSISLHDVEAAVAEYNSAWQTDNHLLPLLQGVAMGGEVTSRKNFVGHVACTAVVFDKSRTAVLQINHNIFKRLLFPGGHVESSDPTLQQAALRELREEVSVPSTSVHELPGRYRVLYVDIHDIPANERKNEPAHFHFDFRFGFYADEDLNLSPQLDEVTDPQWSSVSELSGILGDRAREFVSEHGSLVDISTTVK